MPLHFFDDAGRRVAYVRQNPRRNMYVNQFLIPQRFRFTDEQLDWITDLWNVISAVDGTLVRIRTPAVDGWQYVSRKGTSCLNVCIIADAVGRILYVNNGSPEWVNDAVTPHLLRSSSSGTTVAGYRLLGDMGYGNGGGIITPFRPTAVQGDARKMRYNRDHCRMRSIVEMTIGRMKSRFPILSSELRVGPQRASKIVIACAVLHNISAPILANVNESIRAAYCDLIQSDIC
ncbi:transposase, IS4 family, partial [Ostertagia ostertagi]